MEPAALIDALPDVIESLRIIYAGASVTGRWYYEEDDEAVGYNRAEPDQGYYDRCNPPAGYGAKGWIGTGALEAEPAEPLLPCEWEDYSFAEQSSWLATCARRAKRALERLGVPLDDEPG
jgi:hypothetical protein